MSIPKTLQVACCARCGGFSFPPEVPGCRVCGAPREELSAVDCVTPIYLRNFVTVYAALAPGLEVPSVIGEVALCPGIVEEVRIAVASEDMLSLGMALEPVWSETAAGGGWQFRPSAVEVAR
jgi:uncharacterized OB-fold protein